MSIIAIFPEPVDQARQARLDAAWDIATMLMMNRCTWMWPGMTPHWVGDHWRVFVHAFREDAAPDLHPDHVNWPTLWEHFTAVWLCHQPEWKRRVEISLIEIERKAA